MNSRAHPKYKTKYRVINWAQYEKSLVQRGDIILWITPSAVKSWTPSYPALDQCLRIDFVVSGEGEMAHLLPGTRSLHHRARSYAVRR